MDIREINEGMSLKYEFRGIPSQRKAPLFLKGMFAVIDGRNKEAIFVGVVSTGEKVHRRIEFVKTDKEMQYNSYGKVWLLNPKHFSPTRIPLEVSNILRKVSKDIKKQYELELEVERFNKKKEEYEKKAVGNFEKLDTSIFKEEETLSVGQYFNEKLREILLKLGFSGKLGYDWEYPIYQDINGSYSSTSLPRGVGVMEEYDRTLHIEDESSLDVKLKWLQDVRGEKISYVDDNTLELQKIISILKKNGDLVRIEVDFSVRDYEYRVDVSLLVECLDSDKLITKEKERKRKLDSLCKELKEVCKSR